LGRALNEESGDSDDSKNDESSTTTQNNSIESESKDSKSKPSIDGNKSSGTTRQDNQGKNIPGQGSKNTPAPTPALATTFDSNKGTKDNWDNNFDSNSDLKGKISLPFGAGYDNYDASFGIESNRLARKFKAKLRAAYAIFTSYNIDMFESYTRQFKVRINHLGFIQAFTSDNCFNLANIDIMNKLENLFLKELHVDIPRFMSSEKTLYHVDLLKKLIFSEK
jgi:hypothetical protein